MNELASRKTELAAVRRTILHDHPITPAELRAGAWLRSRNGRTWLRQERKRHGLKSAEAGQLAAMSGATILAAENGEPASASCRILMMRMYLGLGSRPPYMDDENASKEDGDGSTPIVSEEQDGQLRLNAGIDVTPAAWLNDLIALHKAIGGHELVSGPKVRNVLEQIIRDLGGEV